MCAAPLHHAGPHVCVCVCVYTQVYEYVGWIETLNYQSAESPFSVDSGMQSM